MPLAVFRNGEIQPIEPLPSNWREGQCLRVEATEDGEATAEDIDRDFAVLAQLCADNDPEDEKRLAHALEAARQQSKAQVRRQMGLSE